LDGKLSIIGEAADAGLENAMHSAAITLYPRASSMAAGTKGQESQSSQNLRDAWLFQLVFFHDITWVLIGAKE